MKKRIILLVFVTVIALSLFSLSSCDVIDDVLVGLTGNDDVCQHVDADDNGKCDKCDEDYTDGKDVEDEPICQHRDADDNGKCDKCNGDYTDGKDVEDEPICQHRDADDNGKCDKCNEDYTDGKDVEDEPCQHIFVKSTTKEPTCTQTGEEKYTCSKCDHSYTEQVEKLSHTPSAPVEENRVAATCTVDGSYDTVVYCTVCDAELSRDVTNISAGHSFVNGVCKDCGAHKVSDGLEYELNADGKGYTVTGIGSCEDMDIVIPAEYEGLPVTSIGNFAFEDCRSLTSVTIPEGVTSIGYYAFRGCTSLTSVFITDIAAWCNISFAVSYSNPLSYAHNLYLDGELVTELVIPEGVTSIGDEAFYSCNSLTSVTMGNGVTSIGDGAFCYCASLTSVIIPDSVTSIGGCAFYDCTSLTSVTIPEGVTSIEERAFMLCTSLTSVTIPEGVTSIGEMAFYYCTSLMSVTIPDSVTSIGNSAFYNCTSLTSVTIPEGVTSIGGCAFYNCTSLTSITIPEGVMSIGYGAFHYCTSLTSVIIPDSVTSIEDYAFADCTSLANITVAENNANYKSIDGSLYSKDGKTLIQYAIGKTATSFTIPDSVTSIGDLAFSGCTSLTSITIPDSVTSIGAGAFYYCTSLTTIYYRGSESEWVAIEKGSSWDSNTGNYTVVYDYEG